MFEFVGALSNLGDFHVDVSFRAWGRLNFERLVPWVEQGIRIASCFS